MLKEKQLSQVEELDKIEQLKKEVDQFRPFDKLVEQKIMQKFKLEWTYHSNAIEGNPYNYGETVSFLLHGVTANGKKLKDHLDIKGHHDGVKYILDLVKGNRGFSESDIRALHKLILVQPYYVNAITPSGERTRKLISIGQYKTSPNHVETATGEMHYYASPEETPSKMQDLMNWYNEASTNEDIHPLIIAALFHHEFVAIHPFDDGNGRLARILMNFILIKKGYPPIVIKQEDRDNYYGVLAQADTGDYYPIVRYLSSYLERSLIIQLKGLKGEPIFQPEDIDKRISIFKASLSKESSIRLQKNKKSVYDALKSSILPLVMQLDLRLQQFEELFFSLDFVISYDYSQRGERKIIKLPVHKLEAEWLDIDYKDYMHKGVEGMYFEYHWTGFKKGKKAFNAFASLKVLFYDFNYVIDEGEKEIRRLYDEVLDTDEINQLISQKVEALMQEIQDKLRS